MNWKWKKKKERKKKQGIKHNLCAHLLSIFNEMIGFFFSFCYKCYDSGSSYRPPIFLFLFLFFFSPNFSREKRKHQKTYYRLICVHFSFPFNVRIFCNRFLSCHDFSGSGPIIETFVGWFKSQKKWTVNWNLFGYQLLLWWFESVVRLRNLWLHSILLFLPTFLFLFHRWRSNNNRYV